MAYFDMPPGNCDIGRHGHVLGVPGTGRMLGHEEVLTFCLHEAGLSAGHPQRGTHCCAHRIRIETGRRAGATAVVPHLSTPHFSFFGPVRVQCTHHCAKPVRCYQDQAGRSSVRNSP